MGCFVPVREHLGLNGKMLLYGSTWLEPVDKVRYCSRSGAKLCQNSHLRPIYSATFSNRRASPIPASCHRHPTLSPPWRQLERLSPDGGRPNISASRPSAIWPG